MCKYFLMEYASSLLKANRQISRMCYTGTASLFHTNYPTGDGPETLGSVSAAALFLESITEASAAYLR